MKTLRLFPIVTIIAGLIAITGCDKNEDDVQGTSRMTVKMTDAPATYDSVLVEIDHVEVHYAEDEEHPGAEEGWVSLETKAGVYDLLQLRNGVTVVLADDEEIPSGNITQMRLVLGNDNRVVIAGISYSLVTPSAQNSGLKINIDNELEAGEEYEVVLDFDAEKSIVVEGNGGYSLKPVIKVESLIEL